MGCIIAWGTSELLTVISNRLQTMTLVLLQNPTNTVVGCIRFNNKLTTHIGQYQDGSSA